jgi:CO/xanthine dehydrogenase Mo-binding subunit
MTARPPPPTPARVAGRSRGERRPTRRHPQGHGAFAFSSDLYARGMLWGRTLRSPHPAARIVSIDTSAAEAMAGVAAVITAEDVPGKPVYGLEHADQPVFASEVVRYQGEPIAAVAAEHPELARNARSRRSRSSTRSSSR